MVTVACAWGYCGSIEPTTWGAEHLLDTPCDLLDLVHSLLATRAPKALVA
jgi:hypothetical protein